MSESPHRDSAADSQNWEARYAEQRTGWERGSTHPAMIAWCEDFTIKPAMQIVIPGCGRGPETIYLANRGFTVTAIDFAAAPIAHLQERLEGHNATVFLRQQDIFEFAPATQFDAIYEQTCLCAIAPDQRPAYEQTMFGWLKPGGLLLALFMQAPNVNEGPPFHCDLAAMKQLFPKSRWNWPSNPLLRYDHPNGKIHERSAVLQKRNH